MLKKGLNPLISTFLLIALAVTFGVVIMNWDSSGSCTNENIDLFEVSGTIYTCFGNDNVKSVLRNSGNNVIEQYVVYINNGEKTIIKQKTLPGMLTKVVLPYPYDVTSLRIVANNCEEKAINIEPSRCLN